ncbi:hypothetical protein [Rossellomorea marisflavi]|uniref:hypothetical protein n=1 Tax=Rossellomorea marisflavi TaxID=189381 RepID=UPI003512E133
MKKRKLFSIMVVVPLLLTLFSACSSQNEDASPSTNTNQKRTSKETSSNPINEENNDSTKSLEDETPDTNSDSKKDTNQDTDSSDSSKEDDQNTEETTSSVEPSGDTEHASEPDHSTIDFHLDDYLNTNYILDGTHYKTESFGKIEGTDRMDYRVNILPDTQDFGQEINDIFKKGTPYEDKRTEAMMNIAENIIGDLPVINKNVHIDSVNWVSYDGKTEVMLIQDYEQNTIN